MTKLHQGCRAGAARVFPSIFVGILVLWACPAARAITFTILVTLPNGQTYGNAYLTLSDYTYNPDGSVRWSGFDNRIGQYNVQWDLLARPDSGISAAISLTNLGAVTETFAVTASTPLSPPLPAGRSMFGSSALSIADASFDASAAMGAPPASAVYNALIGTNVQRTLFGAPFSLSSVGAGGVQIAADNFTGELTTFAATEVGLRHSFTLSPGDTATMNSTFTILAVPEPGGVLLALLGALGIAAVFAMKGN